MSLNSLFRRLRRQPRAEATRRAQGPSEVVLATLAGRLTGATPEELAGMLPAPADWDHSLGEAAESRSRTR